MNLHGIFSWVHPLMIVLDKILEQHLSLLVNHDYIRKMFLKSCCHYV